VGLNLEKKKKKKNTSNCDLDHRNVTFVHSWASDILKEGVM
jgi:hypothetical protein